MFNYFELDQSVPFSDLTEEELVFLGLKEEEDNHCPVEIDRTAKQAEIRAVKARVEAFKLRHNL